jgi:hypothetical protein
MSRTAGLVLVLLVSVCGCSAGRGSDVADWCYWPESQHRPCREVLDSEYLTWLR